jgi:hypothetical protein
MGLDSLVRPDKLNGDQIRIFGRDSNGLAYPSSASTFSNSTRINFMLYTL